jgi:hypothetical protein
VKRPAYTNADRVLLVLLARVARTLGTSAHHSFSQRRGSRGLRELFRLYWKRKSKASSHRPKVAADTIALIRQIEIDPILRRPQSFGVNTSVVHN